MSTKRPGIRDKVNKNDELDKLKAEDFGSGKGLGIK
ncbi:hypothetical protein MED297_19422 [Reinekea sp. MED297]|uniref:Uncharacterized protein n=1 Tax=Reinekea blandensis MED297 TaxID=314283 RepID=A4B8Y9_9GAMM|nr:hypothetical protein MED297_19422 [Reinekea sp. MED297] [Reinekea blandensis MED297]